MKTTITSLILILSVAAPAFATKTFVKGPAVFYRLSGDMRVKAMSPNTTNRLRPLFKPAWTKVTEISKGSKARPAVMTTFGDKMYITDTRGKNGSQTQEWGYRRNKKDYFHGVVVSENGVNIEVLTNTSGKMELLTINTAYPGKVPERKSVDARTAKQLLKAANKRNGKPYWKLFFK